MSIQSKECSRCKRTLPAASFYRSKKVLAGLDAHCKECHSLWAKQNPDKVREYQARHRAKESTKAYKKAWREANRERLNAMANARRTKKRWEGRERPAPIGREESARRYYALNYAKWANDRAVRKVPFKLARPAWADKAAIIAVYKQARTLRQQHKAEVQVDHIVPLRHELVCGLHNEFNLRVVPAEENRKKSNRTWPDMPTPCNAAR